MLPTSLAIAWPLWRRHRWGLLLVLGYLLAAVSVASLLPMAVLGPQAVSAILGPMTIPLLFVCMYLLGVFSYGFDADLNARESCFPAGLFHLPVRTEALALWPMVYGAAGAFLLWLITAWFILRPWLSPWGLEVPLLWPAMLAVATVAWFQALLWAPSGLPGLRILLAVTLFSVLIAVTSLSVTAGAPEASLVGLFGGCAGIAWVVGYIGVRQARRGNVPNWARVFGPLLQRARALPRPRQSFASAARAQVWFEWRRTGSSLILMTGLVLPFALLPLLFGKNDAISPAQILVGVLLVPVLFAGFAGTIVSGHHPWVKDYYGVAPFNATLPMTTAGLLGAKLKAAVLSTLATWALLVVMTAAALLLTGNLEEVRDWWRQGLDRVGLVKVAAGITTVAAILVIFTWKRLIDSLFLGLTGRKWVINGCLVASMFGMVGLWMFGAWFVSHPADHETILTMLPWLLGAVVFCKLLAAGWALRQVLRRDLLTPRTLLAWVTGWVVLGTVLFGLLVWLVPRGPVPVYYLVFAVSIVLPTVRLAAAPLALAWNRHR